MNLSRSDSHPAQLSSWEATVRKAVAAISELSESPEMHERRRIFEEQASGWRVFSHSGSRSS